MIIAQRSRWQDFSCTPKRASAIALQKLKPRKAEQQKVEARKKAAEAKRSLQEETRRKVLVGAVVLKKTTKQNQSHKRSAG